MASILLVTLITSDADGVMCMISAVFCARGKLCQAIDCYWFQSGFYQTTAGVIRKLTRKVLEWSRRISSAILSIIISSVIIYSNWFIFKESIEGNIFNIVVITVAADVLAPSGARTSAGAVLTKSRWHVYGISTSRLKSCGSEPSYGKRILFSQIDIWIIEKIQFCD